MSQLLISVIMPAYNCKAYIGEAIESVLAQTYRNFEIIVVDGSDDDTKSVLAPYLDKIAYLYQEPQGVATARNLGLQKAQGKLIAFFDADDVWLPEKLSIQVEAFLQHPEAGIIFSDNLNFDESGVLRSSACKPMIEGWFEKQRIPDTDLAYGWLYQELLVGNCIGTCSILVRREVLNEVGIFDEAFRICEDYDLWMRIARRHPALYVDRVLSKYRVRPDGLSGSLEERQSRWNYYGIQVREKHLRQNWVPHELQSLAKEVLSERYWDLGWHAFHRNRLKEARRLFLRSVRYRPWRMQGWLYAGVCLLPLRMLGAIREVVRRQRKLRIAQVKVDL